MRSTPLLFGIGVVFTFLVVVAMALGGGAQAKAPPPQPVLQTPVGQKVSPAGALLGGSGQRVGDLNVWLSSVFGAPGRGQAQVEALVTDGRGQPVNDIKVYFDVDMTNMSHGKYIAPATRIADGRYNGAVFFMMPGPWRIIVSIERAGRSVGVARFDFLVGLR